MQTSRILVIILSIILVHGNIHRTYCQSVVKNPLTYSEYEITENKKMLGNGRMHIAFDFDSTTISEEGHLTIESLGNSIISHSDSFEYYYVILDGYSCTDELINDIFISVKRSKNISSVLSQKFQIDNRRIFIREVDTEFKNDCKNLGVTIYVYVDIKTPIVVDE